ncbi:toxin YhaV, partial [Escherichia coli]
GRYRLFFRYSEKEKVIILGWMNDENTLRTDESPNDFYQNH